MSRADIHLGARALGVRPLPRPVAAAVPQAAPVAPGVAWTRRYRAKLVATDTVIVIASSLIGFALPLSLVDGLTASGPQLMQHLVVALFAVVCWLVALASSHSREQRALGVGATEYKRVVTASLLTFGILAFAFLTVRIEPERQAFVVALPVGVLALLVGRWSWRRWLTRQRTYGNFLSRALVVGDRADVAYVTQQILKKSGPAYTVVGAAVHDSSTAPVAVKGGTIPVVAQPDHLAGAVTRLGADAVIVAGEHHGDRTYLRDLGWDLEATGAELVVASSLTNVAGPRIHVRPVEGLPLMHVELPHFEGGKHVLKRIFDIAASGIALLLLLPVMGLIAIAIRRDSDGPVLFRQERVGRGGEPFYMLKFRSMVQTAEDDLAGLLDKNEGAGVLFKMKNDPRVTRVGRFLRAYSLDELPQLINIFRGEMSLVGPRPPLPREVSEYEEHVNRRLYIKPGLTGMWQVNGRSDLDWEESVRLDLYYVENWSLTGDLMIIWRTFRVLVRPVGAY